MENETITATKTTVLVDDLIKTESSNVTTIAYQDNTNTVFVGFKNGGMYQYNNVNYEDFINLRDAQSVGKHLSAVFLKKGFEYKKLENTQLKTSKLNDEDLNRVVNLPEELETHLEVLNDTTKSK